MIADVQTQCNIWKESVVRGKISVHKVGKLCHRADEIQNNIFKC